MSLEIDQLLKGINVEMEHTDDRDIAKKIAMDHLKEDSNYYDKLEQVMPGEVPDPRGDGAVVDTPTLENGQSNIISYANKEPLLFQAGENSSHDYPGKIVINNESNYVDREVKKNTIPGPAATGSESVGNDTTQPTIPTGAPQPVVIPSEEADHNMHGLNFNNKINFQKGKDITQDPPDAQRTSNEEYLAINDQKLHPEDGDLKQDLPAAAAFSDTGIEVMPTVDPDEEGLHNTGKDLSRTGPEGNAPYDNNDSVNYQGTGDVKVNIPTPYYQKDAKKIYDISGVVPEYQEDIRIVISDPEGDEEFMPEIKIDIAGTLHAASDSKNLESGDLKNHPGRKDSGTHINTIPAGEKGIEDLIQISPLWKEKDDSIGLSEDIVISADAKSKPDKKKDDFLKSIFKALLAAGTITGFATVAQFIKAMKEQDYEQFDMFKGDISKLPKLVPRVFLKYQYHSKTGCKICEPFNGLTFAEDDPKRPILPSENLGAGVFNTHPHCICTFKKSIRLLPEDKKPKSPIPKSKDAKNSLKERNKITDEYLRPLSEALNLYRHRQPDEFNWIKNEEIERMKEYSKQRGKGRFILAVASGESVTDHRPEGVEIHRRRWSKNEMMQNIRTSKGKLIDINHMYSKIDPHSGGIYDANWNHITEKGEVMIWETDEVILDAIRDDIIGAVSINTGKPRRVETNCSDGECFIEPEGTILGEENGVALAYVVTASEGFDYHGQHIPGLPPGMKFTKIYIVE